MNIWLIHYTNKDMKYFRRDKNMCEKLNFKIDGQWFTDFIRRLYYSENNSYKECKEKLLKSLCLDYISEDDKEKLAQSIIFGDKKFIVSSCSPYLHCAKIPSDNNIPVIPLFSINVGLGILLYLYTS